MKSALVEKQAVISSNAFNDEAVAASTTMV